MKMASLKPLLLSLTLVLSLTACELAPWREFNTGDPVRPVSEKEQLWASVRQEAMEKKYEEVRSGALQSAEENYRASPSDPYAALDYAKLLRKVNMTEQAEMVLSPFVQNPAQASEEVLIEYAKLKLAMGDFDAAQMMAQEATFISDNPESMMVLGVALDAQGHHGAAENHLRQALANVGMDVALKNRIMNNLAVSLMAQGRKNEAALILSQIEDAASAGTQVVDGNKTLAENL